MFKVDETFLIIVVPLGGIVFVVEIFFVFIKEGGWINRETIIIIIIGWHFNLFNSLASQRFVCIKEL